MSNARSPKKQPWKFTGETPPGDHPELTQHMAESAVNKLAETLRELVVIAGVHNKMAPITAGLVLELCRTTMDSTLEWIQRWPK